MANYLNNPNVPRGIRNNNPGNLVRTSIAWNGKIPLAQSHDTHFEQFVEMKYGVRAMMLDLISDIKKGKTTVSSLVQEYAPSFENNTSAYIATVENILGFGVGQILDLSETTIKNLCKAMITVENGKAFANYVTEKDYTDALAILGVSLKKKVKQVP